MFYKNKNYEAAIQTVKLEIGTYLGCEKDEEAFIVLKEMPSLDMTELSKAQEAGQESLIEFFRNELPRIIKAHNLMEDDDHLMSNEAVAELIYEKFDLTIKIITEYSNAAFFTRLNKKKG